MAANTSDSDTDPSPARAYDSDDRGGYDGGLKGGRAHGIRSYQSSGYDPSYGEMAGETSYQGGGMPAPGQARSDDRLRRPGAPRRPYDDMPEATGGDKSIGEALGDVTRDLSVLVQQELALAKAEVRQTATRAGQTAGMFAGAAVAAFLFVVFVARPLGGNQRPNWVWLGAVIVAVIWLVAGVVLT